MVDLLGGEERIDAQSSSWGDSFIVNFGTPEVEGAQPKDPKDLENWHVDGDFFVRGPSHHCSSSLFFYSTNTDSHI
jgi:hypothetical protein